MQGGREGTINTNNGRRQNPHGWDPVDTGRCETDLIEDSHGYVVVSADHLGFTSPEVDAMMTGDDAKEIKKELSVYVDDSPKPVVGESEE